MAWRTKVEADPEVYGVAITISQDIGDGIAVEPLRIPDEAAQALYVALAERYGPATDVRMLRADLDWERQRTDRLIEHLAAATRSSE
jgi:hypothetical protein